MFWDEDREKASESEVGVKDKLIFMILIWK